MPAVTAWIHIPEDLLSDMYIPRTGGRYNELTGLARCYKLSHPVDFDGDGVPDEYLVTRILFEREHMHAEIAIFPCDAQGSARGETLRRRGGSITLPPPCPKGNPEAIEFVIRHALAYHDITVTDPPPPAEPDPEPVEGAAPPLPPGLDYDPDVLPDDSWYIVRDVSE